MNTYTSAVKQPPQTLKDLYYICVINTAVQCAIVNLFLYHYRCQL